MRVDSTRQAKEIMWLMCLILAVLIFATASCSQQSKPSAVAMPTEVAKVRVSVDGKLYLNDSVVTLDELNREFHRLKQAQGGVWFLDESSTGPSKQQDQTVKKAIIQAELPMRVR